MARIIKRRRNYASPTGYRSSRGTRASGSTRASSSARTRGSARGRNRRYSGIAGFVQRYYKILAIAGIGLVIVVLCIVLIASGQDTVASHTVIDPDTGEEIIVEGDDPVYEYTDEELAGLEGTGVDFMFDDDEMMASAGIRIGVTVEKLSSAEEQAAVSRFEEAWSKAKTLKKVSGVYYYDADGNYNQHVQDVRSLINRQVDVIVIAFTTKENYEMAALQAQKAGIPIVAYNAPAGSSYDINVVTEHAEWGAAYGRFVAQKLTSGVVVPVLYSQSSEMGLLRSGSAKTALTANAQITVADSIYTEGSASTAKNEITKLLTDSTIDAVICDKGLAEPVLDAFIAARKLPKVMCGDVTAGFIKKWYALKNGGIDVTPAAGANQTPPPPETFSAQPGEFIVCAQPAPSGGLAAAFDIAVEMAKGRKLKQPGQTYKFGVQTMITDANLATYYAMVKDWDNSLAIGEYLTDSVLDSLLHPLENEQ